MRVIHLLELLREIRDFFLHPIGKFFGSLQRLGRGFLERLQLRGGVAKAFARGLQLAKLRIEGGAHGLSRLVV